MKKKYLETAMAILLLAGIWLLTRQVALAVNAPSGEKKLIVVDAGHGGDDPGMIGVGGLEEKGINLTIATLLKTALEEKGFTVVLTRNGDEGLYQEGSGNRKVQDMQNRCKIIRETAPLLTVSLHQNSYSDPGVRGPQVFYYEHSVEGEALANVLQASLNQVLEVERPRKAKGNTSYYLLKRSEGILNIVECGFLTNPQEAELLQQEAYQKKVAEAVCQGIVTYLEGKSQIL